MSRQNQRDERTVASTVTGLMVSAAAVYAGYKLFETVLETYEQHQQEQQQQQLKPIQWGPRIVQPDADEEDTSARIEPIECKPQSNSHKGDSDENETREPLVSHLDSPHQFPNESKILVVNTVEECQRAMKELKAHCQEMHVLGIDCVYSDGSSPMCLQLASHRGLCVLVRLSKVKYFPKELEDILQDRSILKVGVMSSHQYTYLFQNYHQHDEWEDYNPVESVFGLDRMAKMAECEDCSLELSHLSETYLRVHFDVLPIRARDWKKKTLSATLRNFAATNALVAVELFKFFANRISGSGTVNERMRITINVCLGELVRSDRYQDDEGYDRYDDDDDDGVDDRYDFDDGGYGRYDVDVRVKNLIEKEVRIAKQNLKTYVNPSNDSKWLRNSNRRICFIFFASLIILAITKYIF